MGGGGLGSGPSLKMGGGGRGWLSEGPSQKNEGILELKIIKKKKKKKKKKKNVYFLKGGPFGAAQVRKVEQTNVYF